MYSGKKNDMLKKGAMWGGRDSSDDENSSDY